MSAPATEHSAAATNGNGAAEQIDEGFRVYVGNLPYSATEEQIRDLLKPTGTEPLSVSLPMKFNRPAGFAFVAYKEESDAKTVVEQLNGKELGERKLLFEVARSKEEVNEARKANQEKRNAARAAKAAERKEKAEATGEAGATTTDGESKPNGRTKKPRAPRRRLPEDGEEAAEGEEAPAAAESTKPKKKRNRKPKTAAAAATEGDDAAAKEARIDGGEETQAADASAPGEKQAKPKREKKPRAPRLVLTGEESKSTIFVANLPFNIDDDALSSIFTNLSINVKSAKVVRGLRKGRPGSRPFHASKGFGFVEVEDPAQQEEAVKKVDGALVGDRNISARVAHEMKPAEKEEVAEAAQQTTEASA